MMMNFLTRSPQPERKSTDVRFDVTIKAKERASVNSVVDALTLLINEFGKGIDVRKHGSVSKMDISKKAITLLTDLDRHLSDFVASKEKTATFEIAKVEDVLLKTLICPYVAPVDVLTMRRNICACFERVYTIDRKLIAKSASKLVTILDSQASTARDLTAYSSIIAISHVLVTMCKVASSLLPPFMTMLPIFLKLWKLYSDAVKVVTLELCTNYVTYNKRSIASDWYEYIKMAQRGAAERSIEIKKAAGDLSLAVASRVTPDLASNRNFEAFLGFVTKCMDDPSMSVRASFGCAAGELLYRVIPKDSAPQDDDKQKKSTKLYTCGYSLILLTSQFSKVGASKDLREAISISVIHFLSKCSEALIEMNIEIIVSNIIGLLGNVKAYITAGDLLQAQMYVSQMIRMGIVHRLDESGRLAAVKEFTRILSRYTSNQYAMLCLLREIAALCSLLGEVVESVRDLVIEAIMVSLCHSSDYVRYAGALATKALSNSIPTHSISLVSALVNMVQIDHAELVDTSNNRPQEQEKIANALHGHSNALAALIFESTKQKLAVSHILCSAVLDTALLLGKISPNMSTYVTMRRQEACWVLVCSVLSLSDHWVKINMDKVTDMWEKVLGAKAIAKLPSDDATISATLREKAAALLSLNIFLKSCTSLLNDETLNQIYGYFAYTIKLLATLPPNYKPATSSSLYSINILKLYLFELIRKLPSSILSKPQQKNVINFVTKLAFAEIDGTHNGVETSLLHTFILEKKLDENEMHAPDIFDIILEDEMRFFSKSGQLYLFSQENPQFQEITVEADSSCILDDSTQSFFERPLSLNVRLVDSAIQLLGNLFQYHKSSSKNQIVEYFISHIKSTYNSPDDLRLSNTVFSNVIASLFCILTKMKAKNTKKSVDEKDKGFFASVHSILTAALAHSSQSIRRAASKALAVLASMIGGAVIEDLLKKCATKIAKDGPVKSGYALALGDVNKGLGSLSSRNHLPQTVSFLIALSRSTSSNTQLCAFQSMWNTIETSGVGFGAYVESILQHLISMFFSPVGTPTEPHLNQDDDRHVLLGATRVLYAFTSLGPDVVERANFKEMFHLLVHDILSSNIPFVQIEATRLIERSILLAPMLIPNIRKVVVQLKRFLSNPKLHSGLRRMITNCIKIIAEKQIDMICELFTPKFLFDLLDNTHFVDEEEGLGAQYIKQIITLEIQAKHAACKPKLWIELIHDIVSSESRRVFEESTGDMISDTDENEIPKEQSDTQPQKSYSCTTKVFAVNCLLEVLNVYKSEPIHLDAKKAKEMSADGEYLVQQLAKLIDICSIALNRGTFSSKYAGLISLMEILRIFENLSDPDIPDEPILLQYTAKFGAAISLGFEPKSPPILCYQACELAKLYIPSKLLVGQPNSMSRICSYMTDQLPRLDELNTSLFGEVATTMIKVVFLSTLAFIYNKADESNNKELLSVLDPHLHTMFINWTKCLRDYALLNTVMSETAAEYSVIDESKSSRQSSFIEEGTELIVKDFFLDAFPNIIDATTRISVRKLVEWKKQTAENDTSFQYEYDMPLVLGIAVKGLYDNKNTANSNTLSVTLSCIRSLTRIISSEQYLSLPFAPGATFELFLLLIKVQTSRDLSLQYACLKLLNTIVNEIDVSLFGSSDQVSTQAIVTTSTEVCLKPLRLEFPMIFEQDSEQERVYDLTKERLRLVKQCMSCLKTIIHRFKESVNGASVTTILYSLCRIIQYTQSSSCIDVAIALSELEIQTSSLSSLDEASVWTVAFEAAIESLRLRMRDLKITTHLEVELLFIFLSSINKSISDDNERLKLQFILINESIVETLRDILSDSQALSNAFHVRRVSLILQGVQNGLVRLAKSSHSNSNLALFFMSEISGPVCAYLMKLFNSGRVTNEQFENHEGVEGELIVTVIPACLNILLAGYSLIEPGSKSTYLQIVVPLLVAMLRMIKTNSTISSNLKHQDNLNKLHKLAVQCLERLAQTAATEFTLVVKSLPPTVVLEIQQEVKKGKESSVKSTTPSASTPKPKQKLEINFDAYVAQKQNQQSS